MSVSHRSPLGRAVSEYLRAAHPDGLTVSEIYDRLVADVNFGGTKQGIMDLLTGNPDAYVKGAAGHWLDAVLVAADGGRPPEGEEGAAQAAEQPPGAAPPPDRPSQRAGHFADSYVVFDLETLIGEALEQRRIIEIAALKFVAGAPAGEFRTLVDPGQEIDALTENKTHISSEMVIGAPAVESALPQFASFIGDLPLVAHNGRSFDLPVLNHWNRVHGLPEIANNLIDTLDLAVVVFPTQPTLSLGRLNDLMDLTPFVAHRAEADVAALAAIFRGLLVRLAALPVEVRRAINAFYAPFVLCDKATAAVTAEEPEETTEAPAPAAGPPVAVSAYASAEGIRDIFAVGGPMAEEFGPSYEDRPSQTEMAALTWQAFAEGQLLLIEAPTGTGKTNAYLYPSIVWARTTGQKVFISAHTRQLQEQIREAIEKAQRVGFPVRYAILKGRDNYVCWTRWQRVVNETPDPLLRAFLLAWRVQTAEGMLDEFPLTLRHRLLGGAEAYPGLLARLSAASEVCDHHDAAHATCPYQAALHRAWGADLIVVNHALLLTTHWGTQTRPPLDALVIDEAHNLEDAATTAVQADISDRGLSALISDCESQARALTVDLKNQGLRSTINQLRFHLSAFSDGLVEFVRQQTYENETDQRYPLRYRLRWGDLVRDAKGRWAGVKSAYNQVYGHIQALADELAILVDEASLTPGANRALIGEARLQLANLRKAIYLLDDIVNVANANNVYWVELPPKNEENPAFRWALHRAPIKVDWYLRKQLYDPCRAIVFTSATLTVNGGFDFFLNRFGLERVAYRERVHARILPSVFQTKQDILFAIPQNIGRYHPRRAAEFIERASQEVHQLLHLQPQRSLLLFNARARMQAVHKRTLRPLMTLGLESGMQGLGSVQSDLEALRDDPHRVQFGVRTLWEGVDVPGMSYVIIEKLPFPLFFDPVVAARMERAKLETGSDFYGYTLPHMVIRFKQGFGRLYRRNTDHGVVVLLDRALRRASYRDIVFRSLPEHTFTPASEEELYRQIKAHFGGVLTPADLLRQRTAFERQLEEYTLRQATFSRGEYDLIRPKLLAGLKAFFDFDGFIGKQEALIRAMLTGGDTLGVLPTGAGKSLTFQLPGILRDGLTLVVSPLIALMKDQVDKLRDEKGIRCVDYIVSGQTAAEQDEILQRMVGGELRLVYVSPERFRDRRLHEALGHCRVVQFVVDEAHCVSMWGHDFRPDFLYIHDTVARLAGPEPSRGGRPPIMALTATATPPVKTDIKEQLHMKVGRGHEIVDSFDRPNLRFVVQPCRTDADKERWLMRLLYRSTEPAIVYVATRRDADLIASMLRDRGIAARAYHAGMERFDRDAIQDMFMNDQIRVVVATNAFGMGVDKPDIKYVIHYHFPGDIESFYQEAGRAGRKDQIVAYSVVLYMPRDRRIQEYFIERSLPSLEALTQLYDFLRDQKGETLYLADDDLAEALPFDEQALRVGMHILEREGYIRRGYDFAAGCAIKIFEPVADVLEKVEDAERRVRLATLIAALKLPDYGEKRGVNLARLCRQIDLNPEEAELFLIRLNRDEILSFRSWERGYTVNKQPRMATTPRLALDRPALLSQVQNARAKLDRLIRDYLETRDCRRSAILSYFGEQPLDPKCHKCDRCGLPEEVPWSQTFDVDLPDLYTVYHPGYVAIEAAAHFQGQYGRTKVIYTLIGQNFSPFDKKALPRGLTDSDYFKALRGYKYEQVWDFYGLLEAQGYVTKVYKEIGGQQLPMIGVTEKGIAALESGELSSLPTIEG